MNIDIVHQYKMSRKYFAVVNLDKRNEVILFANSRIMRVRTDK